MSLICGTLTWLRDFEEKQKKDLELLLQGSNIVPEFVSVFQRVKFCSFCCPKECSLVFSCRHFCTHLQYKCFYFQEIAGKRANKTEKWRYWSTLTVC